MDAFSAIWNLAFFVLIVYLISRVAHHFNNNKKKLNEMDKKIDEIKEIISKEDS
ncbi:hypothetical protein [Virgibacillus sp. L01]|uniref:hypothetical protein n=1 Tax=Virgibacillus sp. L01 TaxID=3457429 RepID=UPI003FD0508E